MRTKYNVNIEKEERTYQGITFDSKIEMKYYRDVVLPLYATGEITHYELQKHYELQPGFTQNGKKIRPVEYVADFYLEYKDGRNVVIDIKGFGDAVALLKRKMFWYKYPNIAYYWICYSKIDGGWCTYEDVRTARRKRKKAKSEGDKS